MNIFKQNLDSKWQKPICTCRWPCIFLFSNIDRSLIFCIFYTGFRFFWTPCTEKPNTY